MTTVLVVDDDQDIRDVWLAQRHWQARGAPTLGEGLRLASDWQPQVILLDVGFKNEKRTGIDLLPEFKRVAPCSKILVLTGLYNREDQDRAVSLGAFSYVEKGDPAAVRKLVKAAQVCGTAFSSDVSSSLH